MKYQDIVFTPYSDIGVNERDSINKHQEHINSNNYNGAASVANKTGKGFTASFFNAIRDRIRSFETFLLNKFVAEPGEYYSYNDPNEEEMPEGTELFIQILS